MKRLWSLWSRVSGSISIFCPVDGEALFSPGGRWPSNIGPTIIGENSTSRADWAFQ